jgi:hypothetical protein
MQNEVDIRQDKTALRGQLIIRRYSLTTRELVIDAIAFMGTVAITAAVLILVVMPSPGQELALATLPDAPSAVWEAESSSAEPAPIESVPTQPAAPSQPNAWQRAAESKATYRASEALLLAGTMFDAVQTWRGLTHPTQFYAYDGGVMLQHTDYSQALRESGWARIAGPRNAGGVVGLNLAVNTAVFVVSHELAKRGGKWRAIASAMNGVRGATSLAGGYSWVAPLAKANSAASTLTFHPATVQWLP